MEGGVDGVVGNRFNKIGSIEMLSGDEGVGVQYQCADLAVYHGVPTILYTDARLCMVVFLIDCDFRALGLKV